MLRNYFRRRRRKRRNFWNRIRNNDFLAEGYRQKFFSKHGRLPKNY